MTMAAASAIAAAAAAAASGTMGRVRLSRGLLGAAVASAVLLASPGTAAGTPAPSRGVGEVPTSAPLVTPELAPNSKCGNGFPGVESANGKTCCMAYCIECAGVGCSDRGNSSDCCATEIALESQECDLAGEAPCFIVPPQPWEPEHTMVYFAYFVIIPFIVLAILCNYSLLPCFREKGDPNDPANTAHLHGHNIGPAATTPASAATPAAARAKKPPSVKADDDVASTL